jgi:arsenite-transporting ATPase
MGPLSGLQAQRLVFAAALEALRQPEVTRVVLVSRPEAASLREAARAAGELRDLGIGHLHLVVNGLFSDRLSASDATDPIARAWSRRSSDALAQMPAELKLLPRQDVPMLGRAPVGLDGLRMLNRARHGEELHVAADELPALWAGRLAPLDGLVDELAAHPRGVVFTMGKGGVGKTSVAVHLARALAARGVRVHLTTTDPAAHVAETLGAVPANLRVSRIDPEAEVQRYTSQVMATTGAGLDAKGKALLAEDLRSPCTEEIAVFEAFALTVAQGQDELVVIDTAPTGHTLLLLDAAEAYHREVQRKQGSASEAVRLLLPRLRDPAFARVLLVTLPEATPVHEAAMLERDLRRAGIAPHAWVVNQVLTGLDVRHPLLRARQAAEAPYLAEVAAHAAQVFHMPWLAAPVSARAAAQPAG